MTEDMNQVPASAPAGGMATKIIIGLVVLAVVGWAIFAGVKKDDGTEPADESATSGEESEGTFSGNFFDLMSRGGNQKCTWVVNADGYEGEGTVYVSGKKFASHMTGMSQGTTFTAYSVGDGEYLYSWSDMAPMGMKIRMDAAQQSAGETAIGGSASGPAADVDYDFNCSRWSEDADVFALPEGVTFSEFNY